MIERKEIIVREAKPEKYGLRIVQRVLSPGMGKEYLELSCIYLEKFDENQKVTEAMSIDIELVDGVRKAIGHFLEKHGGRRLISVELVTKK